MKRCGLSRWVVVLLALATCNQAALLARADDPLKNIDGNQQSTLRWLQRKLNVPSPIEKRHATVLDAYRDVVDQARLATVRVLSEGSAVAMGVVVREDGYILTKASELGAEIECELHTGRRLPAELVHSDRENDLALLAVDYDGLPVIAWRSDDPSVGSLLASPGTGRRPLAVGVLSVGPRRIQAPSGVLGVLLEEEEKGPRVGRVIEGSSADEAGIQQGDLILQLNGRQMPDRQTLIRSIRGFQPGDRVKLVVSRGEEQLPIQAVLGDPTTIHGQTPLYVQNTLGGPISRRRSGFPLALQHDTVLQPEQCGGALVGLDGKAIGINIARAGRVASYAIPASVAQDFINSALPARSGEQQPSDMVANASEN